MVGGNLDTAVCMQVGQEDATKTTKVSAERGADDDDDDALEGVLNQFSAVRSVTYDGDGLNVSCIAAANGGV